MFVVHVFFQKPELPAYLLPRIDMRFRTFESPKEFCNRYTRHAGFGIKTGQTNGKNKYLQCSREGEHTTNVQETDRQRITNSRRCKCKARLRLKKKIDESWVIEDMNLEHTHRLLLSPSMLVFLHSHKSYDPCMQEFVKFLQFKNLKHYQIMEIISSEVGGERFLGVHGKDLINE
jgi:hypothetical protein